MSSSNLTNLEWKYVGSTVSNNIVSLPSDWKEIYVVIGSATSQYSMSFLVPRNVLTYKTIFEHGMYYTSSNYSSAAIAVRTGDVHIDTYYKQGSSALDSNIGIWVYYK